MTYKDWKLPWVGVSGTLWCFCELEYRFWLQISSLMMSWSVNHDINLLVLNCAVQPLFVFPRSCWELGCPDVFLQNQKVKRSEQPQKLEIESDEIEFELNLHMLLLFSASLLVLLLPLLLGFSSPPLTTFCGTVCSSSIEIMYWCQVVNLLSLFCSSPVVFRGSSHFLLFPPTCQKTQVDNFWCFAEKPLVWGKCHDRSLWCFPLFLFKVLKVSFHRTLVVELTPETF